MGKFIFTLTMTNLKKSMVISHLAVIEIILKKPTKKRVNLIQKVLLQ